MQRSDAGCGTNRSGLSAQPGRSHIQRGSVALLYRAAVQPQQSGLIWSAAPGRFPSISPVESAWKARETGHSPNPHLRASDCCRYFQPRKPSLRRSFLWSGIHCRLTKLNSAGMSQEPVFHGSRMASWRSHWPRYSFRSHSIPYSQSQWNAGYSLSLPAPRREAFAPGTSETGTRFIRNRNRFNGDYLRRVGNTIAGVSTATWLIHPFSDTYFSSLVTLQEFHSPRPSCAIESDTISHCIRISLTTERSSIARPRIITTS